MAEKFSFSPGLRLLTRVVALLYLILGLILFLLPDWSAANFAWKISPWVAMTIGGWCLGNAFIAYKSANVWNLSVVYPNLIYLGSFALLQLTILFIFKDKLILDVHLAWLYVAALVTNLLIAGLGVMEWQKVRSQFSAEGSKVVGWVRGSIVIAIFFVAFLALTALFSPAPNAVTEGEFLPEKMSLFTMRAFGAFYLSLVIAGFSVMKTKGSSPIETFGLSGLALTIPITIASLIYFQPEELQTHPGGIFYIGAYLVVFAVVIWILYYYRKLKNPT